KALAASSEYALLDPVRRRIIDHELRDFRLAGAELPAELKPRFQAIQEELEELHRFLDVTRYPYEFDLDQWKSRAMVNAWVLTHSHYNGDFAGVKVSEGMAHMDDYDLRRRAASLCSRDADT
ncbi:MAG: hypothetical protein ACPL2E_07755, partial [Conexivisphaera sp.]